MTLIEGQLYPLPPKHLLDGIGDSDYLATGKHFLDLFIQHGGLGKTDTVLDIGCGCGRIAVPLSGYLDPDASYHGLDVVLPQVAWCRENITPLAPNFRFHHADVRNSFYNSQGSVKAVDYRFPFDDGSFDFIFLTSVMTHLTPEDATNYLREVRRLLKPDGRVFATFFLVNSSYFAAKADGKAILGFADGDGPFWVTDPDVPEAVSGYDEVYVFEMFRREGFVIDVVSYGGWNGARGWTYQDVILARRTGAGA